MYLIDFILLLLSIILLFVFRRKKEKYKLECIIALASTGLGVIFLFLSLSWNLLSYYLRYIFVFVYLFIAINTVIKIRKEPVRTNKSIKTMLISVFCLVSSIFFTYQIVTYINGYHYQGEPVRLSFPFENGVYEVQWGGNGENSPLMNYHFNSEQYKNAGTNVSMKYATDISKLDVWGRSGGVDSKQLENFPIFGEKLYSPCDGEIIIVQNGWTDNKIGDNMPYNAGNTIVIKTNSAYVLLGHLKNNSIIVKAGDKVKKGQQLAEIGSSGASSGYPHLHIQAMKESYWGSEGLPIVFDGKFAVKNSIFIK